MTILETYLARTPKSAALATEARRWLPGGVVSDTRSFDPYGIYVSHALGVSKRDVDCNDYLDFFGGHGAHLLGHGATAIVDAVRDAVGHGTQFAANQPLEVALAREVIRHLPSAGRVRFTASGTEATLLAIRLARAHTGRAKIVRFASHYHGWHDHAASGYAGEFNGVAAPGVLREVAGHTLLIAPGDVNALAAVLDRHGDSIAGFMIEPVGTHFGVVPLARTFLSTVERAARSCGALLILDEVLSGFRVALGGAQAVYGLRPDLTTLAKVLCGGMPGGAVAGRADILDLMDSNAERRRGRGKVLHQGTFSGNPISMAAGLAGLRQIASSGACDRVNALGAQARRALNALSDAEDLPFSWYGEFSAFHLSFTREPCDAPHDLDGMRRYLARPQPVTNRLRMALNNLGVDLNTRCSGLLSAAHDETHIDQLVQAVARAAHALRVEGLLPAAP